MRLLKYLNERSVPVYISNEEFDTVVLEIKKKCKPWLSECGKQLVYRGIRHDVDSMIHKTVHQDRKPSSTPEELSKQLDVAFKKSLGWKPRSEGVFVTGDIGLTLMFGSPYITFPEGPFKIAWCPDLLDLTERLDSLRYNYLNPTLDQITDLVNEYKDDSLPQAIKNGVEISVKCSNYIGLRYESLSPIQKKDLLERLF